MGFDVTGIGREAFARHPGRPALRDGLAGALASVLPLVVGAVQDRPLAGLTAGLGALNVALATPAAPRPVRLRWGAAATAGCVLAAGLGATVDGRVGLHLVATLGFIAATTAFARRGARAGLLGFVLGAVFVIVSGLTPAEPAGSVMVQFLLGGCTALLLMLAADRDEPPERTPAEPAQPARLITIHAVRVAVAVTAATGIAEALSLEFGYWVPLTTLAVLQPEHRASFVRVVQRCVGTIVGVAVVATVTAATGQPGLLIPLVGVSAFVLFALRERSYYWVVVALTPTALLMISTADDEGALIAGQRLLNTAIGLLIAVLVTGGALLVDRERGRSRFPTA